MLLRTITKVHMHEDQSLDKVAILLLLEDTSKVSATHEENTCVEIIKKIDFVEVSLSRRNDMFSEA